jgi:hypothetical protein
MATVYVRGLPANASTHRYTGFDRWRAGQCMQCGELSPCRCRYCNSCSEYWVAASVADCDDGERPRETCPECSTEGEVE